MNRHFALFFSWIQSQKSEVEIHTSLNGLQEKYKFTFSNFTDSLYIQLSNLSGAGCAKLVFPDCIAGVNRKQSTAQHTAHCWTDSKAGEVKEKILPDFGEIQRGSGRLCVKINGTQKPIKSQQ